MPEQHAVHERGNIRAALAGPVLLDVEHDHFRFHVRVDDVDEVVYVGVVYPRLEEIGGSCSEDFFVRQHVAQVLGEGGLARAEEAGDPDSDTLSGFGARLVDRFEEVSVLPAYAVGDDILGDLRVDGVLVRLVDLDDLLDLPVEVSVKQSAYLRHDPPAYSFSRLWAMA